MMQKRIARFAKDESGVTAIEYGLIALLVAVGIIASLTLVGTSVIGLYNDVAAAVGAA